MKDFLTDQGVEVEIERLRESPYVKLAKKEEALRYRRRQYMYQRSRVKINRIGFLEFLGE